MLRRRVGGVLLACAILASAGRAWAQTVYLLTTDGNLVTASASNPAQVSAPIALNGLVAGETLVGIDVRPQNQKLYALGINSTADTGTVYHLEPSNGFLVPVGAVGSVAFTTDGVTVVDLPDPAVVDYDIDFNPTVDRIRVVASNGLNFRLNPNTGAAVDGNLGGMNSGTNPDVPINGGTMGVGGAAYTNNEPDQDGLPTNNVTTLYTLDAASDSLFRTTNPNGGTQTLTGAVTLGGAPLNVSRVLGFDIAPGVDVDVNNAAVTDGRGIFVASIGDATSLYSIDLVSGVATAAGALNVGVRSAAIRTTLGAGIVRNDSGSPSITRFDPSTPTLGTNVPVTGIASGESVVGIDGRPNTGQLYALGVNATADTATLYQIDPQSGAATAIGVVGQIAFVDENGAAVDLPAPSVGYGFDFNPTVDRIRVVTGNGLNFRINPNNGSPVDGNLNNPMGSPVGINTDAPLVGGPGAAATAYTNSFGQPAGGVTTLYSFDQVTGNLYIQDPPNFGVLKLVRNLLDPGIGGAVGFDIPSTARTSTSGAASGGEGWLLADEFDAVRLYRITLATGSARLVGSYSGSGATGLVVWASAFTAGGNDEVRITTGPTRFTPLANDPLDGELTIISVSDPEVVIDGRTLIIPEGFDGDSFTYTASNGFSNLQATVTVTTGVPRVNPTDFNGLIFSGNGDIMGWASVAVSTKNVATLQIRGRAEKVVAKISLPPGATGRAFTKFGSVTLTRNTNGTVSLSLDALGGDVTGTLRANASTATAATLNIALKSIQASVPGGGYAVATVSAKGAVKVTGVLPDGGAFTAATTLANNGSFAFYGVQTKGAKPAGVFGGELFVADLDATDVTGELIWSKPPQASTKGLHLGGVDTTLTANGSIYAGELPLQSGTARLSLAGGNLGGMGDQVTVVEVTNGVPATPAGSLKGWTGVSARSGKFIAKIQLPDVTRLVTGSGLYLPKSNSAWGFFPGKTVGGRIELRETVAP